MSESIITLEVRETRLMTLEIRGMNVKQARKLYREDGKDGFCVVEDEIESDLGCYL